ncbi:MAG TPA: DNA translocase FtsK, partial [Acidimicrobiales bacterium]|nr:DNA translocase FtsK [Acidimicrobiales bacterium]
MLLALVTLACVLFTGVTLRAALAATGRAGAGLWRMAAERMDRSLRDGEEADDEDEDDEDAFVDEDEEEEDDEEPEPDVVVAAPPRRRPLFDLERLGILGPAPEVAAPDPEVEAPAAGGEDAQQDEDEHEGAFVGASRAPAAGLDARGAPGEWRLPRLSLLARSKAQRLDRAEVSAAGRALVAALANHGVETRLVGHTVGPSVTRFELELGPGVKVARVTSLAKDIAYAMASPDVRILAPIPGKSAIGVEVPNRIRQLVTLGDVLASEEARRAGHPLEVALGRDIAGRPVMENLADMPHILICGATGAGKSSCINSLLTSVMMRATPEDLRLILVDPKRVELGQYNGLPHLLTQVVVDPKKAANALSWAVAEMERRYDVLAEAGMRDITGYNAAVDRGDLDEGYEDDDEDYLEDEDEEDVDAEADDDVEDEEYDEEEEDEDEDEEYEEDEEGEYEDEGEDDEDEEAEDEGEEEEDEDEYEDEDEDEDEEGPEGRAKARVAESRERLQPTVPRERLPFVLVVVDELNDLMMVAARDVEDSVCRIAQMARAVGIHLVIATQRPSVDVITGVIKANIPSRLAFSVSSLADSRVILDQPGAERLIGKGDMLLLTASSSVPRRIQGPWVAETEVRSVVAHWKRQRTPQYVEGIAGDGGPSRGGDNVDDDDDDLLHDAMELVVRSQLGSTSMLQRKLRVGFSRAGRLMDLLERRGVVGPSE